MPTLLTMKIEPGDRRRGQPQASPGPQDPVFQNRAVLTRPATIPVAGRFAVPETMSEINVSEGGSAMSTEKLLNHSLLGYARVSTLEQDEALQVDALHAAGCGRVFVDKASGKHEHRPQLDALLDQLRPGDTVVVWRLDRLGRSLRHLIDTVQDFDSRGVAFRSLRRASTPPPPAASSCFTSSARLPNSSIASSANGPWPGSPQHEPVAG